MSRLVLAHGFTQNTGCWGPFADLLANHHSVILVDGPGHGRCDPEHDDADLWRAARLLTEAGGRGVYLGYSMGGRTALHAALAHPELVEALILIGATPGLRHQRERAERRQADDELAQRLLTIGLEAFLDQWLSLPLFAGLDGEAAARPARLGNRPEGLAASLRHCGTGGQDDLWPRLGELTMPVLLVVGDRDQKFSAIAQLMAEGLTGAESQVRSLPGTHAVHLEQPGACAELVLGWLADR